MRKTKYTIADSQDAPIPEGSTGMQTDISTDIFISYRRGEGDSPNAGRIFDFLSGHGYRVFYDRSEKSLPTGEQFPETLARAADSSRIILAVIGKSWVAQMARLHDPEDWVRAELRRGAPNSGRHFIPVFLGTKPNEMAGHGVPDDMSFVVTANSQCLWEGFDPPQQEMLLTIVNEWLPRVEKPTRPGVTPRLELLCDRFEAETCFRGTLRNDKRGWLLLGDLDQGQHDLFERLKLFSLRNPLVAMEYPSHEAFPLYLGEFFGRPLEELRDHLFLRCSEELREGEIKEWEDLTAILKRRQKSLLLFWAVAQVENAKQVDWWSKTFRELLAELPAPQAGKPRLLLAFALSYDPARRSIFSWLRKDAEHRLAELYPERAGEMNESASKAGDEFATCRLKSVRRLDVMNWCSNPMVTSHLDARLKADSLQPFEQDQEIPMAKVIQHLAMVLARSVDNLEPRP